MSSIARAPHRTRARAFLDSESTTPRDARFVHALDHSRVIVASASRQRPALAVRIGLARFFRRTRACRFRSRSSSAIDATFASNSRASCAISPHHAAVAMTMPIQRRPDPHLLAAERRLGDISTPVNRRAASCSVRPHARDRSTSSFSGLLSAAPSTTFAADINPPPSAMSPSLCIAISLARRHPIAATLVTFFAIPNPPPIPPSIRRERVARCDTPGAPCAVCGERNASQVNDLASSCRSLVAPSCTLLRQYRRSRGESNPRPQAITGQFYMRSCLI